MNPPIPSTASALNSRISFFEWRSAGALVPYIATVRKVLVIAGAILFIGLGWIWVLADPKLLEHDPARARGELT